MVTNTMFLNYTHPDSVPQQHIPKVNKVKEQKHQNPEQSNIFKSKVDESRFYDHHREDK